MVNLGDSQEIEECFSNLAVGNPTVLQGHPPQENPLLTAIPSSKQDSRYITY